MPNVLATESSSPLILPMEAAQAEQIVAALTPAPESPPAASSPAPDADLESLLRMMISQAQEYMMLLDDAPPEDRADIQDQCTQLLGAALLVSDAIAHPSPKSRTLARRGAALLQKGGSVLADIINGDEHKQASNNNQMLEERTHNALSPPEATVTAALDDLPAHIREYYAHECDAAIQSLNAPETKIQLQNIATLPNISDRQHALDHLVIDHAFHALSQHHQTLCAAALDVAVEEITPTILAHQLTALAERDGFNPTIISNAFSDVRHAQPNLSNAAQVATEHTLLAFEALHLAVDAGTHHVKQHETVRPKHSSSPPTTLPDAHATQHLGTVQTPQLTKAH